MSNVEAAIKDYVVKRKWDREPAPKALQAKVASALKAGETTVQALVAATGLAPTTIYKWAKGKTKAKAKTSTPKAKHKSRRRSKKVQTQARSKQARRTPSRVKGARVGVDFAELQNSSGEILRIPFNKDTLPFIIQNHYGRD